MKRIVLIIVTGLLTMSAYAQHKINQTPAQSLMERHGNGNMEGVMFMMYVAIIRLYLVVNLVVWS